MTQLKHFGGVKLRSDIVVVLLAGVGLTAIWAPPTAGEGRSKSQPDPNVTVVSPGGPVLAGRTLAIRLKGKPGELLHWQFGYKREVLAEGRVKLDAAGGVELKITSPKVRHRAVCKFVLPSAGKAGASRQVVVYPTGALRMVSERTKAIGIGVVDETGRVQRALKEEGARFRDLRTQLQRDSFDGGMIVIGGFRSADALVRLCTGLRGRVKGGLAVVLLNPPDGWGSLGMKLVQLGRPRRGQVVLAGGLASIIAPADLGDGPWVSALQPDKAHVALVHLAEPAAPRAATKPNVKEKPSVARYPLVPSSRAACDVTLANQRA